MNKLKTATGKARNLQPKDVDSFCRHWIGRSVEYQIAFHDLPPCKNPGMSSATSPRKNPDQLFGEGPVGRASTTLNRVYLVGSASSVSLDIPAEPCRLDKFRKQPHQAILVVHVFQARSDLAKLEDFPWGHLGWIVGEPDHLIRFD